ncbi:MAG TPA: sulfite exporter TauE/SafE family protein [Isosphaeraceae bacterium]|nr:sulfite exporter TauE/SafE family protein [Isosphaeraceae bacterium]
MTLADHTTLPVLTVLFLATLIRSAFGFGEALVAVPLLALLVPVEVAAPLAVLVSVTVAGLILLRDWRQVHAGSAGRLVLSTMLGIPIGLLLLTTVAEPVVKAILAAVIILFSASRLVGRTRFELKDDRLAWVFGFWAGVLGGAYGMNGPPLVAYGALRRWSPERFRATLQAYFLPASLVGMVGYWVAGLWVPAVTVNYLTSLPVVLAATFLGRFLNRRLDGPRFLLYIYVGLMIVGTVLLIQSVWSLGRS